MWTPEIGRLYVREKVKESWPEQPPEWNLVICRGANDWKSIAGYHYTGSIHYSFLSLDGYNYTDRSGTEYFTTTNGYAIKKYLAERKHLELVREHLSNGSGLTNRGQWLAVVAISALCATDKALIREVFHDPR